MAMGSSPISPRIKRSSSGAKALLVELVDTTVSSSVALRHAGSIPAERRRIEKKKKKKDGTIANKKKSSR